MSDLITSGPFTGLMRHGYRVISMDAPWFFSGGKAGRPQHYKRMRDHEIAALPVKELAHPDGCWFLMWITSPKLYCGFKSVNDLTPHQIAHRMGFRWSGRGFVWVKTQLEPHDPAFDINKHISFGQGFTTRKSTEDVLIFKSGKPKRLNSNVQETIVAKRREHSRKPDEFYRRAMLLSEGPYLELFSRESREGWTVYGDEARKFDIGEARA